MFWGPAIYPQLKVKPGHFVRKTGETMDWEVVEADDEQVIVRGPGGRKGLMAVARAEFNREWQKV